MIGTNSPFRLRASLTLLAVICAGFAFVCGCNDAPTSIAGANQSLLPNAIPIPDGHKPETVTTVGLVEQIEYAALRLLVNGTWFFADLETDIVVDDCNLCAFTDIQENDPAKIHYNRVPEPDGSYYAREIEIERADNSEEPDDPEDDESEIGGIVEAIDGDRLLVSGVWFWMNTETELEIDSECTVESIIVGDFVKIEYSTIEIDDLGCYALKIEIKRDCDGEEMPERE